MRTQTIIFALVSLLAFLLGQPATESLPAKKAAEGTLQRHYVKRKVTPPVLHDCRSRIPMLQALLIMLPIFWMAAFDSPRADVVQYVKLYQRLPTAPGEALAYLMSADRSGIGFLLLELLISVLSQGSVVVFRITIALLQMLPLISIYRRYSTNYGFTVFLFMANGCHLAWLMNGLRQFLAVAIILHALPWLIQRRYLRVFLSILAASLMHTTAIVMLPVVLICTGQAWNRRTMLCLLLTIIGMVLFSQVEGMFDALLANTEYANVMRNAREMGDDGVNPIRVLVNMVPILLALIARPAMRGENDPVVNLCINMSVITLGINLIAMVTSGVMLGRLAIYTNVYSFILLPWLMERVFAKNNQKLATLLAVGFYGMYYIAQYGF